MKTKKNVYYTQTQPPARQVLLQLCRKFQMSRIDLRGEITSLEYFALIAFRFAIRGLRWWMTCRVTSGREREEKKKISSLGSLPLAYTL